MLKFLKETEKTAKSVEEAISLAMTELKVADEKDIEVEVLEEASKGFLGIGSKDAKIRATVKDANAVIVRTFLSQVFDAMGLEVTLDIKTGKDTVDVEMSGAHMGIVIGKRGDTLDSLQYLTSLVVNHENDDYIKVTLDTENYREKRAKALLALSERLAEKVKNSGKKYTLEPMNPYERRIIHANLQDNEFVTTFSVGEEPYRKVIIAPKNAPAHTPAPTKQKVYSYFKKPPMPKREIKKAENFEAYASMQEEE